MFIWFKLYCADYCLNNEIVIGTWKYTLIKFLPVRWNKILLLYGIEISFSLFKPKMGEVGCCQNKNERKQPEVVSVQTA